MLAFSSSVQAPSYEAERLTSGLLASWLLEGLVGALASWLSLDERLLASLCWNLTSFLGFVMMKRVVGCDRRSGDGKSWVDGSGEGFWRRGNVATRGRARRRDWVFATGQTETATKDGMVRATR